MDNEYEDTECPECGDGINTWGFCGDCGFDWEQWRMDWIDAQEVTNE